MVKEHRAVFGEENLDGGILQPREFVCNGCKNPCELSVYLWSGEERLPMKCPFDIKDFEIDWWSDDSHYKDLHKEKVWEHCKEIFCGDCGKLISREVATFRISAWYCIECSKKYSGGMTTQSP